MELKKAVHYCTPKAFSPNINVLIPAGTKLIPATNLPESSSIKYWAEPWSGMSDKELSWCESIGFGLTADEVEDGNNR